MPLSKMKPDPDGVRKFQWIAREEIDGATVWTLAYCTIEHATRQNMLRWQPIGETSRGRYRRHRVRMQSDLDRMFEREDWHIGLVR